MPTFKKSILREGNYFSPDRPNEPIVVTKQRLKEWEQKHQRILKSRRTIPVDFDHSYNPADNVPLTYASLEKRRSAVNSVGTMPVFRVSEDADGAYAEILLDITDPVAEGRCKRNEVYVSPVILDEWVDGRGQKYTDVIGHMDLVVHPVDDSQSPFSVEPGAVACSAIRMGIGKPNKPNLFFFAVGDNNMADDERPDDEMTTDGDGGGNELPAPEPEAEANAVDPSKLAMMVMEKIGAEVPVGFDPMTAEGFSLFVTAVMNKLGSEDDEMAGGGEEGALEAASPEFATLSTRGRQAFEFAERQYRSGLASRLDSAFRSGRIGKDEHAAKKKLLGGVRLSLTASGEHREGKLETWLKSREELPAGTVWPGEGQATLSAAQRPNGWNVNENKEDAKSVADWVLSKKKN